MLTTTIHSPQHKRVLRMRNRKHNSPLSDIHRTDKWNQNVITIKKAKEIHLELNKCARNINNAYSLHILFSISTATILIITTAYNTYYCLLTKIYHPQSLQFFIHLFWIFLHGLKITFASHVCAKTVTEAANTGDILCEMNEPSISKEFCTEIHDFILQLIQNPLSFTTFGFFDLDYTLIRNIIGIIASYLVILIQVGRVPYDVFVKNTTLSTNN
ncbi:gustatory and pheromone receptor 32a-like [Vespa velutina]|uniref:gustatory and pheromone receptor 32a-like n=1 Tax=Vespa velutina TaxID=202808 RepID=UPI001FB45D57|nr:gustatory and pheromone receptor 32a-like [Vespa velutina]